MSGWRLALLAFCLFTGSLSVRAQAEAARWRFVTEVFPPFSYQENGEAAGPMIDVLKAACQRLKRTCDISVLPWRRALGMAERGEVEGIFTVVDTPERRQAFYLSPPILEARYSFFSRAESRFQYRKPDDLRGRMVGVYGPSGTLSALRELGVGQGLDEQVELDNLTALRKLAAGRYGPEGLVLINERVAQTLIATENLQGLRAAGEAKRFHYHFGLARLRLDEADNRAFAQAIRQLCQSGDLQRRLDPYRLRAAPCPP